MEARNRRPVMGMAALCASLVLATLESASAQYAPRMITESQAAMLQPTMTPPVMAAGGVQPVVQGRPGASGAAMRGPGGPHMMAGATGGQSENFVVLCNDPQLTEVVSQEAEKFRRELAIRWLGAELPPWSRRCPIHVTAGANLGAGGETQFALYNGNVGDWKMSVQGTPERILDSVLPHEITHTILASHFAPLNTHVPRWADEGACTTVEHSSEQNKHKKFLVQFLSTGRGLSFNRMFSLKDYPSDILPLYAQGHSVVEFLIAQGGPRQFVKFLEDGMQSQQWEAAIRRAYGYETMGQLQIKWNQWIADGRGSVDKYAGKAGAANTTGSLVSETRPASVPGDDSDLQVSAQPRRATEEVAEGSSIQLIAHEKDTAPNAADLAAAAARSPDGARSSEQAGPADQAGLADQAGPADVGLVASAPAAAANSAGASLAASTEEAGEGFYRKRLESKMRDIIRAEPKAAAATASEAPIARTAALDRNSPLSSPALGQGPARGTISGRATARPQDPQSTPMRVIDWGKGSPQPGLQPIYR